MTIEGSEKWAEMTQENIQRQVAITMDNVVYSAPVVQNAITGGNTEITGDFTIEEATDLSGLLNGGALPAPCVIKEQTKVGPTIGAENSKSGLVSFAFAFLAVFIYMYFYYGKGGLIANIALLVNVILIFGCLASFGAVLTLAGIAGIVLTIGTAVDANILIFERIKEEQALGHAAEASVSTGFVKALPSIIDANMTHLLVAIILKVFGTGEIESFATTLIVGIFTSVFSAIIISKLIIYSALEKGKTVSFSTGMTHNLFKNFNFDWIGKRKYFYIFSIAITIAGAVSLFSRGLKQSVEFTGGRTFGVKVEKAADVDFVEDQLTKVFVEEGAKEPASVEVKTKSNSYNLEITTNYMLSNDGATPEVEAKLKEGFDAMKNKVGSYTITDSRAISASVSEEMWSSATLAISLSLLVIFAYILLRFGQWQYSLGAIIGLAHDVLVVLSIFSLLHGFLPFNMDVNQAFIAAILTVIGYSMNDTVIVFDRIRESLNFSNDKDDSKIVINEALNKTLSRTFNTSMILFVVLLVMFIFGGPAIKGFLFALLVGVVIGTYSSLCVATPILIDFTKSFKRKAKK
jgi:SecD/SecF fusion protein